MKKLFTLTISAAFVLATGILSAQSTRMAFVEEATQASCPPCASANPGIQTLVNANSDNTIFMAYQVWWPGFDQMYLDNSVEVDERVGDYYSYIFAPQVVLQGDFVGTEGGASELTQATLDNVTSQDSEFDMTISGEVTDNILHVTGTIDATMAATGTFKLRIMLTEEIIYYEDAPGGTNGEEEYHHVFKAFVGGSEGITLATSWADGDSYTIDETLDLSDFVIYHYEGLEVIAIVQNDDDKFVNQAVKDADVDISSSLENQVNNLEILGLPGAVCSGEQTITPQVKIMNYGNTDLTSCDIVYDVNGGTAQTYAWTGSLSTYAAELVTLDPITFTATSSNTLTTTVENPNGVANENEDNVTQTASVGLAPQAELELTVTINTDCWGSETTWAIKNSSGSNVATGGPYSNTTEYVIPVTLPGEDCYTFYLYDSYGDGMNGSQWTGCNTDGTCEVTDGNGNTVYSYDGSYEFSTDEQDFEGLTTVSVDEIEAISSFNVYPNPTNDVAHIAFNLVDSKNVRIEVLDLVGKVVYAENFGQMNSGNQLIDVNASQIGNGMYIFNIYAGNQRISERVSINK